jgi:hypothetical protein
MRGLAWSVVCLCLVACGQVRPQGGSETNGGFENEDAPLGGGSPEIGIAGSSTGGASAAGGTPVVLGGAGAGASVTIASSAGTSGAVLLPPHSRECIQRRLAEPVMPLEASGGVSGLPSDLASGAVPSETAAAGAGGAAPIDLELGAGDLTVLVIFDKSGSMASGWDGRTKWQVANEAFMKAIEGVLDNLTIGAIFFPDPGGCDVAPLGSGAQIEFRAGRDFSSYWQETAETRVPEGSTPLERSFQIADSAIERGCQLGLLTDRFRVLVVTDGEPTCHDDTAALTTYANEWHRIGVETWVMGIPGSAGAHDLLDAIAAAGGTERHQSLGDPTELDEGLYTAVR